MIMQTERRTRRSNVTALAANVDGDVDEKPGDPGNKSKEDTTDDSTQDPNDHFDGFQDDDSNPFSAASSRRRS